MASTFLLVVIGFIIFRSDNMTEAYEFFNRMFLTLFDSYNIEHGKKMLLYGFALLAIEWIQRNKRHALQFDDCKPLKYRWVRWAIYYALLILIMHHIGNEQTFIYFQF